MKIRISLANWGKIGTILAKLNGKSRLHVADVGFVVRAAAEMEAQLDDLHIYKKDRAGATATSMSGGDVSTGYTYSRIVNTLKIERGSADWFLVAVERTDIGGNADKPRLSLTPAQRDIAMAKFASQFSVQPAVSA